MKCILYLVSQLEVEGEPLWCKIGITSSTIRSRMAGIQCGNPNRIICISSHVFQNRNSASEAEKSMHRRLKNYSAPGGGEWFEYQATIDMWRVSIHEPLIALEKCEDQRKLVKPYLCRHCGDTDGSKFRKGRKTECRECQRTSNVKCGHCGTTNKASFPPGYMTECVDCKDPLRARSRWPHKCRHCGTTDPDKFNWCRKTLCRQCVYQRHKIDKSNPKN